MAGSVRKRQAAESTSESVGTLGNLNVVVLFFDAIARAQWDKRLVKTNRVLQRWEQKGKTSIHPFDKFHGTRHH